MATTFDTLTADEAADALEALTAALACSPLARLLSDSTTGELTRLRTAGQEAIGDRVQGLGSFIDLIQIWADHDIDWSTFFLPDTYD